MENTFKTTEKNTVREIKTFTPVIPEGHHYKPVQRTVIHPEQELLTFHNPLIRLSQTIKCVIMRGVKL